MYQGIITAWMNNNSEVTKHHPFYYNLCGYMPLSYEIFNTKWHVITCLTESIHLDCVLKSKGKIITIESRSLTANAKINHSV